MQTDKILTSRQALVCRCLALAFGVGALLQGVSILFAALHPEFLALQVQCQQLSCDIITAPLTLLPDRMKAIAAHRPEAEALLVSHLALSATRAGLLAAELAINLPVVCLMLSAARSMQALGQRRSEALARALLWLRMAASFALAAVVLAPLGMSLRAFTLMRGIMPSTPIFLSFEVRSVLLNALLAATAIAITWALAAGVRAQRDLAEIV